MPRLEKQRAYNAACDARWFAPPLNLVCFFNRKRSECELPLIQAHLLKARVRAISARVLAPHYLRTCVAGARASKSQRVNFLIWDDTAACL